MTTTPSLGDVRSRGVATGEAIVAAAGGSPVAATRSAILDACNKTGLDRRAVEATLRAAGFAGMESSVAYVFDADAAVTVTTAKMQKLQQAIRSIMDQGEALGPELKTAPRRLLAAVREVLAGAIFVVCLWLVVGGIVTGQNALSHNTSPLVAVLVLAASLACLGALEAAHIGAVALSTADVSELRESHPRVFKLHRFIKTKPLLERYLSGRQAGVVLVVFMISELTRTAGMTTLPGTAVELPGWTDFLFQIGVPGALVVLIIGQVLPQIVTARRPAAVMNTAPMSGAFMATVGISTLGLANPAGWFAGRSEARERIPTADRERHTANTVDVVGHGIEMINRSMVVTADASVVKTVTTTRFYETGPSDHTMIVGSTTYPPEHTEPRAALFRRNAQSEGVVLSDLVEQQDKVNGFSLTGTLAPRVGTFKEDDVLRTTFTASVPILLKEDVIVVTAPTRLVVLHVALEHPTAPMPPARLRIAGSTGRAGSSTTMIEPVVNENDGSIEFTALIRYPAMGTVISLAWEQQ